MKFEAVAWIAAAVLAGGAAAAAELKVVSTVGVQVVVERMRDDFEKTSGRHLDIEFGTAATLKRQLDAGEKFDVTVLAPPMIDDLVKQGKVSAKSATTVAKVAVAIAVKAGKAKPDIGTRDALRSALLQNRLAYTKQGQSGVVAVRLFDVLGIAAAVQDKIHLDERPGGAGLAVAEGKADLAFALLSEIAANPQLELVGPLPGDLQSNVLFAAGIATGTRRSAASHAFIASLRRELEKMGMANE